MALYQEYADSCERKASEAFNRYWTAPSGSDAERKAWHEATAWWQEQNFWMTQV